MAAVTAAVIPAVSGALARRDRRGRGTDHRLRPADHGLGGLSHGGGAVCAGKAHHGPDLPQSERGPGLPLLSTLGLATLFVCMMLVCNSILQAHGFVNLPVAIMLLGGVVKIFTNYHVVVIAQHGDLWGPYGQYPVLCPVHGAGPGGHRPGDPRRPSYFQVFAK